MTLAAWKKGEEIDPLIRITVPDKQSAEYNRLIGMMRAAGGDISLLINTLHLLVEQAEVRFGWLFTLHTGRSARPWCWSWSAHRGLALVILRRQPVARQCEHQVASP